MPAPRAMRVGWLAVVVGAVGAAALGTACAGRSSTVGAEGARSPAGAGSSRGREVAGALLAARYWRATSAALGPVAYPRDFGAFVFGDLTGDTSVEGPVAAGGSVRLAEAALNTRGLAVGLVAGRDVDAVGGSIQGTILHGRGAALAGTLVEPGAAARGAPLDFEWAQAELIALSDRLAGLPANGASAVHPWGGITLTGVDPRENVFEVSGDALARAPTVEIAAPPGAVVIVNVRGSRAAVAGCGVTLSGGVDRAHLLWNLAPAIALEVHAATVPGTVLAPRAAVALTRASIQGTLVAASLAGGAAAIQYHPFVGFDAGGARARPLAPALAADPAGRPVALTGL